MMRSLWSAVSGLNTHQMEMDVIGNNISNVNSTSYKAQATGFKDILYQTMKAASAATATRGAVSASQVGLGARVGSIYTNITKQGSAVTTDNPFNLMITGDSFFVVSESAASPNAEKYFTRDGNFTIDEAGYLVTQDGMYVNFLAGANTAGTATPLISEATKKMGGTATTEAIFKGNIDKDDTDLSDGKSINLEVFGSDGKTYNLKFNLTDANDKDDQTYMLDLRQIVDEDGKSLRNGVNESLLLKYSAANGKLEGIVPYTSLSQINGGTTLDDDGNVISSSFSLSGTVRTYDFTYNVTGTDGKNYTLNYSLISSKRDGDYDLVLTGVKKPSGETVELYDDAVLDFDEGTGRLLTVDGVAGNSYTYSFGSYTGDQKLDIGDVTVDFSELTKAIYSNDSYVFRFTDEAAVLGSISVDFSNTHNYASSSAKHTSTVGAVKGNVNGLNKGYASGEMSGISIGNDGSINASYTNGQNVQLAQIVVAQFNNAMGLEKVGTNMYKVSLNSGNPMYSDVTATGGYMNAGVLEGSNVDLAQEFTDMITTQRGFQANSKVITTSDELLQVLKNLKT